MSDTIDLSCFVLGEWQTNCYVLASGESAWVIDAGFNPDAMLDHVIQHKLTVEKIILTHAHVDHIAGLEQITKAHPDADVLIHMNEKPFLTDPTLNLSAMLPNPIIAPQATGTLAQGDKLTLNDHDFTILETPGHSPGGITLYQPDQAIAIVGDALFQNSIGRFDFPTSDGQQLLRSIHEQLLSLPDQTQVLCGHGPPTTIGDERRNNPYLQ